MIVMQKLNAIELKALDELYLNGEILLIEYEERKKVKGKIR